MGIFDMNCRKYDYEADEDVRAQVRAMIVQRKLATLENFANAREVRNLFEEIITNQARRVAALDAPTKEDMKRILIEDLIETAEEDTQKTLKKASEQGDEKKSGQDTDKESGKEAVRDTDKESGKEAVQGTDQESGKEAVQDTEGKAE